ncbi:hypothetical protein FGRMN_1309 [Fusarium graminum]|nr:hypothetical protein FGRMN_1309 [Fusarium graminum]
MLSIEFDMQQAAAAAATTAAAAAPCPRVSSLCSGDIPRGDTTVSRKTILAPSHMDMGMDIRSPGSAVRRCIGATTPVLSSSNPGPGTG